MTAAVIVEIEEKIRLDWSPEQISETLAITISHERICQPIWADKCKDGQIRNRISIDEHPEIVTQKPRIGDWEIDTFGQQETIKTP